MIDVAFSRLNELIDLGGSVVAILMIMSVIAVAVTLWKAIIFEIEAVGRSKQRGFLHRAISDVSPLGKEAEGKQRIYARIEADFGRVASGLRVLDLTAQIAPLLGLFGTVLGMIAAFRTLQEAGTSADPSVLAGGIWVALLTTAAGLMVAIPASIILSWFDSRLETHRRAANEAVEALFAPDVYTART